MTRVILYALIVGLICPIAWGRAASVKWVAVKTDGLECHQCAVYKRCARVLRGRHLAECRRVMARHTAVCKYRQTGGLRPQPAGNAITPPNPRPPLWPALQGYFQR